MSYAVFSYRGDPHVPDFKDDKPIIVFDGHCVLCFRWANFVIKHDKQNRFRMLAAQSDLAEALYKHYGIKSGDHDTNILLENGMLRVKSDGSLAMMAGLGFLWNMINILRIFPGGIRDWVYDRLVANRIKWFGRREVCVLSPPGEEDRFL